MKIIKGGHMFKVNDFVVYPGHGIGRIQKIETKGSLGEFYNISMQTGLTVVAPVQNTESIGLRGLVDAKTAAKALSIVQGPHAVDNSSWNRRYREHMECLKTGDVLELAKVVGELEALKTSKDLSFGERKMLDVAKDLLFTEIELVLEAV